MNLTCVLGMHRSGTSAAAGLLVALGASAGPVDDLIPPLLENRLGFFENRSLTHINRAILRKLGGFWSVPPSLPLGWENDGRFDDERRHLAELFDDLGADSPSHLVIKDPRLSLTQPLIAAVHPVSTNLLCVRHPAQVAASLAKRNGMPLERSLYLWLRYTSVALFVEPQPTIIRYGDIVRGDQAAVRRVVTALGLAGDDAAISAAIEKAIDPDLAHHDDESLPPGGLGESALALFEHLTGATERSTDVDLILQLFGAQSWAASGMDDIRRATEEAQIETVSLRQKLVKADEDRERMSDAIKRREAEIASLRAQNKKASETADSMRAEFVVQAREMNKLRSAHDEVAKEASSLRSSLEKSGQEARLLRFRGDDLEERIAVLEAQREKLRHDSQQAAQRFNSLSDRRSVKLATQVSGLLRMRPRNRQSQTSGLASSQDPQPPAASEPDPGRGSEPAAGGGPDGRLTSTFDPMVEGEARAVLGEQYRRNARVIDATLVSVVMPTFNRADTVLGAIDSVVAQSHRNWELHVVDDGSTDGTVERIRSKVSDSRIRIHEADHRGVSAARNVGLRHAAGDVVAYLDSDNTWDPDFLKLMLAGLSKAGADCAYSALEAVDAGGEAQYYRGAQFDWEQCRKGNFVDLNVFVHRRERADDIRFDERLRRMVDWDFILRMTLESRVEYLPFLGCRYLDDKSRADRISNVESKLFGKLVRLRYQESGEVRTWDDVGNSIRLRFAIKIPAPAAKRMAWGDFHFAESLASALARLGHTARLVFLEDWDLENADDDVVLVLRGLSRYEPQPGPVHVMWNISHPDKVGFDEFAAYDIVYTASESYARFLALLPSRASVTKPLPQATDVERFHPGRKGGGSPYGAPVLFVGNSRKDFRDIVRWSVEAGIDVTIYGQHWSPFVAGPNIRDELIANNALGGAYAASGVVLNDHWASMRDFGIISNRVFDVIACGTQLVSDHLDALGAMFGDLVAQVSGPDELANAVGAPLANKEQRAEAARWVATNHSFDMRALQIVADVLAFVGIPGPEARQAELVMPGVETIGPRVRTGVLVVEGAHGPQSSAYIRLFAPLTSGSVADRVDVVRLEAPEDVREVDVVIVQRLAIATADEATAWMAALEDSHVPLVVDVDDAFDLIGPDHPEVGLFDERTQILKRLISAADQVWCSTRAVANHFLPEDEGATVGKAVVIPNSLDARLWRRYARSADPGARHADSGQARLLFMGTPTHLPDLELMLPQLAELHDARPFSLTVIGPGLGDEWRRQEWLTNPVVAEPLRNYPSFARWLRDAGPFDIGLAPLAENPFNAAKSDIKLLDYAALGLAIVASNCPAFQGAIDDGWVLGADRDDWAGPLLELINNPERMRQMGLAAQDLVWHSRTARATGERLADLLTAIPADAAPAVATASVEVTEAGQGTP